MLAFAAPAAADYARPLPDPDHPGVGVGAVTNPDGKGGGGHCAFRRDPESDLRAKLVGLHGGAYYHFRCDGWNVERVSWFFDRPQVDPVALAREAANSLDLSTPLIRMNPSAERAQLVNLRTWLWVDPSAWLNHEATAAVPGVSATVTAVPVRVFWDMGDGGRVTCHGPGMPYRATQAVSTRGPSCGYTYRRSSAQEPGDRFLVVATVTWRVSWTASGVAGGGGLPALTRSTQMPVQVTEVQALN
jgi:hypothetical protein